MCCLHFFFILPVLSLVRFCIGIKVLQRIYSVTWWSLRKTVIKMHQIQNFLKGSRIMSYSLSLLSPSPSAFISFYLDWLGSKVKKKKKESLQTKNAWSELRAFNIWSNCLTIWNIPRMKWKNAHKEIERAHLL